MLDENWVKDHKKSERQRDLAALKQVKKLRKGKKYKLIQVDAKTWVEKEIK